MKYTVQIFTGGWHNELYTKAEVLEQINQVTALLDVKRVIIGWNLNRDVYKAVREILTANIELYLWFPVFSEIGEIKQMQVAADIWGNPIPAYQLQEGESFEFYCPTNAKNHEQILRVYDEQFAHIGFDGVFLDKIRSQSFIGGVRGIMSCGCPECEKWYSNAGIDFAEVKRIITESNCGNALEIKSYSSSEGLVFAEPVMQGFIDEKQRLYQYHLARIVEEFRSRGLKIGMDVFFPFMSQFVGQNIFQLMKLTDFIKPMMYRRTWAPAGVGFETQAMSEALGTRRCSVAFSGNENGTCMDETEFIDQLKPLVETLECDVAPGIEVNYDEKIVRTDGEYIKGSILAAGQAGCREVVLSWDLMKAPMKHIRQISREVEVENGRFIKNEKNP